MTRPLLSGPELLPDTGHPTRAVVLLHGYGADGQDLIGLAPHLAAHLPDTAFFAPDGPQPTVMGMGRQWFSDAGGSFNDRPGLDEAVGLLEHYLTTTVWEKYGITPAQTVLVGFSMGTMTALHVAPRLPVQIAGVVGLSGMLMFGEELATLTPKQMMPIQLVHGQADDVLPFHASEQAEALLEAAGYPVALHILPGLPHGIDERALGLTAKFLATQLL